MKLKTNVKAGYDDGEGGSAILTLPDGVQVNSGFRP
jgi:hypothetical protein